MTRQYKGHCTLVELTPKVKISTLLVIQIKIVSLKNSLVDRRYLGIVPSGKIIFL